MSISIIFSFTVYNTATGEVRDRLDAFQERFAQPNAGSYFGTNRPQFSIFERNQRDMANKNILVTLIYVNLIILIGGGALSYALARRTLRQIEATHEAQSRFTSDTSHELRTPLAAMKAELEVALRDPKLSKQEMRELLASNLEEVDKLTTLSKTLLQLSKLDHDSLEMKSMNLSTKVADVIQKYDKNAIRFEFSAPKKPLYVKANQSSIEELITILVDNALKYSPEKTKIKASVSTLGRNIQFTISNPGKGIPADKLPHIFDRFYRADQSRTTDGSGLGLSLAKQIVALHKGELSVSSSENGLTTFTVTLPAQVKSK